MNQNINIEKFDGKLLAELLEKDVFTDEEVIYILEWLPEVINFCDVSKNSAMMNWYITSPLQAFRGIARARNLYGKAKGI